MKGALTFGCVAAVLFGASAAWAGIIQYELQNKSGQDADDVHLVFSHKVEDAKNGAFTDPPQGIGSNTLDWPAPGGSGTVPAGYKWWFKTKEPDYATNGITGCSAGLIPESSYFTSGGQKIDNSVKWTDADHNTTWEKDPSEGIWKASVSLVNNSPEWMQVTNFAVYDNAPRTFYTLDDFNAGYGVLVTGLDSSFWIENNTTITIELGWRSNDIFIWFTGDFAMESDTSNLFNFQMAGAAPIPEPATVLLLTTSLTALAAVRRRRRRTATD